MWLRVVLPLNSVDLDVPLAPSALVQLALHAAEDAPEDSAESCKKAQHHQDVRCDDPPGVKELCVQVDPDAGQHTSRNKQDNVSLRPQLLLNIHDPFHSLTTFYLVETGPSPGHTFNCLDET